MQGHLKPLEFIRAIEEECLSHAAAAHLKRCSVCRDTLQDLRDTQQIVQRSHARATPTDEAFWNEYTQAVCRAVKQKPSHSDGAGWMRPASLVLVLSTVMVFLFAAQSLSRYRDAWSGRVGPHAPVRDGETLKPGVEVASDALGLERLDFDDYLYTRPGLYDQLQQDLSSLHIGPELWAEAESGWHLIH